jgi:hypothetical protein
MATPSFQDLPISGKEVLMSKYEELRTVLSDERYLLEALNDFGYCAEISPDGLSLYGYLGDERPEKANIVIRRQQLNSASNDIGFARDANGVYRALISEYDRGIGFDDAWLGRVAQTYKERQTMAIAKAKGYRFLGRQVVETQAGKKVQLRFAVR